MTNLPAVVSTLNQEIGALTDRLSQVGFDDISFAIDTLKRGGMMAPSSIQPANLLEEYRKAMTNVPKVGLFTAVGKLKIGEYPRDNYAFMPHPSELAAMARAEARLTREDLARKRDMLDAVTPKEPEVDRSPEVLERVKAKRLFAVESLRSKSTYVPHEPLDAESAEYWSKIQAIKDADGLSAEQAAFRRRIATELDAVAPKEGESYAA